MPRPRRVLSEGRQMVYALVIAAIVYALTQAAILVFAPNAEVEYLSVVMGSWAAFAASHSFLAWRSYAGRRGADLHAALVHVEGDRMGRWAAGRLGRLIGVGDVTGFTVQLATVAVLGTLALGLNASVRSTLNMSVGVLLVATCWLDTAMAFAVAYARTDQGEGGLEFPGAGEREFSDYLYLGLAGQATFGTTDVGIASARLRRTMTVQSLVAFVFNTVVVAMLVSLMVSGSGAA